jgi:hypothetical protein
MRAILAIVLVLLLGRVCLAAECKIEDWRYLQRTNFVVIEGATSCATGKVIIRAYNGDGGDYIGNAMAYIEGYSFSAILDGAAPKNLTIKYVIETR